MLFTELPLLRRPRAAREAGFDAVEFWWPFDAAVPSDSDVDAFVSAIDDAGVTLTGLNFAGGDMGEGERGLLSNPVHRKVFRDNVDVAFGIADRLGTTSLNALYGNRIAGLDPHHQDDEALENLSHVGRLAEQRGATIVLEPLSGIPHYPLRTAADAIAVIDRVRREGVESLRLLADLYHLHVNGDDVSAVIDEHVNRIGHVQIADAPGRGQPGTGIIDLDGHLAQLHRRGYRGYVGLEYRAEGPDRFGWLQRHSGI